MKNKFKNFKQLLINILVFIILLIFSYNSNVLATTLSSGGTTISSQEDNVTAQSTNNTSDTNTLNDPTIYNPNADSNTYTLTDQDQSFYNTTRQDNNANLTNNTTTNDDLDTSNLYNQATVSITNTITTTGFDITNLINILLIVIGVLIIVFAGAILIKLRLNQ